jgi:hypothetical protein
MDAPLMGSNVMIARQTVANEKGSPSAVPARAAANCSDLLWSTAHSLVTAQAAGDRDDVIDTT